MFIHFSMKCILVSFQNCGPNFESSNININASTNVDVPDSSDPEIDDDITNPVEIKILNSSIQDIAESSVAIEWNLSKGGNGQVEYGEVVTLGQFTDKVISFNDSYHKMTIENLKSGTFYYYKIISYDDRGTLADSEVQTFTTLDASAPIDQIKILNSTVSEITQSSVAIEWTLSKGGSGQIEYGETSALGELTTKEVSFEGTYHKQSISNLKAGTSYFYKIISYDDVGVLAASQVATFKTLDAVTPPEPPATGSLINKIAYQGPIAHPLNAQPATPRLPNIGEFIDMPGTNGKVEFTRLTEVQSGNNSLLDSYAKRSAVDPFNKYIFLNSYIYSLSTLKPLKRNQVGYEYVPSMTQEDLVYGISANKLVSWNIVTDIKTTIWSAPGGASDVTIGRWEGQQSFDDRYIVLCFKQNGRHQIVSVDIKNKKQLGQVSEDNNNFNWADVSPSGKYVLVGTNNARVYRYDINMQNRVTLNTRHYGNGHADVMYDMQGNEVIVQEGNYSNGDFSYVTLADNQKHMMDLVNTNTQTGGEYKNTASHISGLMTGVPGKVFISLQKKSGMYAMFAADLSPGQNQTQFLGYTFTKSETYSAEAKATISSDGNTIVWTSDWMKGGNSYYTFLARIKK